MTTISIDETDHEALCRLAEETGKPLGALLHDAIVRYRREALLEANNAAYGRLMQDPIAFQEELEEQKLWDRTVADGLKDW